ncbi:MAG: 2-oxo acid dehydrogenase subunit E2 [Planctomycetes bacterium]|nr:2-oxo acid dehydrogenase subunit E2 [Planctomycetota bacterium]
MASEITMPRLSDTMQAGTIVRWAVKEGQKIKSGDLLADIETDKATMEQQSFDDGVVAHLAVGAGTNVPVGTLIAVIAGVGEDVAAVKAKYAAGAGAAVAAKPATAAAKVGGSGGGTAVLTAPATTNGSNGSHGTAGSDRIFVSPLARKIAEESGVNLAGLHGSGPSGRIIRKDVEAALGGAPVVAGRAAVTAATPRAAAPAPSMPAVGATLTSKVVPLSNMRRVIAQRLVESKVTIPHYQVTVEIAMDALLDLRKQLNEQLASQGVKLSVNDFLVRACALAMHQHPYVNSRWVGSAGSEAIELLADVNIGVAISLDESKGGGLVVATLRGADQMGLRQISAQTKQLADKARAKGLSPQEMSDSTFTISNLGMYGVDHFTAIINPPNVAILAVGAAIEKPVVKKGQLAVGSVMSMTMSSDHRVVDGAMAAQYLATVKGLLESPATLLV